jgi:hypothetical protein
MPIISSATDLKESRCHGCPDPIQGIDKNSSAGLSSFQGRGDQRQLNLPADDN